MIIAIWEEGRVVEYEDGVDDSSYNDEGCGGTGTYLCMCGGDFCVCGLEEILCEGCPDCCPDWDEED